MTPADIPEEIPARLPGETPADYLKRLKDFERDFKEINRIVSDVNKEASRRQKRIESAYERVVIEKAVRRALRSPRERFYQVPDRLEAFGLFAPLFLLISLIWQNKTHTDTRFKNGLEVRK